MPHILVVDDEVDVCDMLCVALTREGYQVRTASNGREALKTLQSSIIDLVITDLIMPEIEGLELIKGLHCQYPQLKIIAISGGGSSDPQIDLSMAQYLGAHRTFLKPFKLQAMLGAVREMIGPGISP
ncbi:MAG TPA: response regulator [Terriglobia bacterium]|nr:response regulator [Terriglobia bacterium]